MLGVRLAGGKGGQGRAFLSVCHRDPCLGKGAWRSDPVIITLEPDLLFLGTSSPCLGLSQWLSCKESTFSAGDASSIPGWGRSPGGGNGYPLQYSCLENSMDRGSWQATVHGVPKSWTRLSD